MSFLSLYVGQSWVGRVFKIRFATRLFHHDSISRAYFLLLYDVAHNFMAWQRVNHCQINESKIYWFIFATDPNTTNIMLSFAITKLWKLVTLTTRLRGDRMRFWCLTACKWLSRGIVCRSKQAGNILDNFDIHSGQIPLSQFRWVSTRKT